MNKLYRITLDATKTLLATEDFVQTFHSVEELTKNITEPVIVVVDGINIADCYEAKILKLVCNFFIYYNSSVNFCISLKTNNKKIRKL